MSEIPPEPPPLPPPVDYLQPDLRPPEWPGYIAWGIIVSVVAFLFIANIVPELRGRDSSAADASVEQQMEMSARYAVGVKSLPVIGPNTPAGQLIGAVDKLAKSAEDKLRVAILAAELEGAGQAEKRLGAIETLPPDEVDPELRTDITALRTIYSKNVESLDPEARLRLSNRHQYFGKLALSFNQPPSDPMRQEVVEPARKTAIAIFVGGAIALALGAVGLALLILGIVMLVNGKLRRLYQPQPEQGTVYVEMFAAWLVLYLSISVLLSAIFGGTPPLSASWLLALSLPLAIAWPLVRGQRWGEIRRALGWHAGRGWHIELSLGVVGYLAGLPIVVLGIGITWVLIQISGATPSHPIQTEGAGSAWQIIQLYGIASIFAPILEETMFRGALFHHLRRRWSWLISAGIVGLIFATIHPQGWAAIPALGSIAIVLAGIREWRDSILAPMAAHAFSNGMVVTLMVALK